MDNGVEPMTDDEINRKIDRLTSKTGKAKPLVERVRELRAEIDRLRAELAEVTRERDRRLDPSRATQITLYGHDWHGYEEAFLWLGADRDDGNFSVTVLGVDNIWAYRIAVGIEAVLRKLGA